MIELGGEAEEVKDFVLKQKEAVRSYLAQLAVEANLAEPERASHELMLIIDGATVTALFRKPEEVARHVRSIFAATSKSDRL